MSPEITEGLPYDISADVWSLGVTIYHLCTFKFPFTFDPLMKIF